MDNNFSTTSKILAIKNIFSEITDETKHELITCADLQSVNNYFEIVRHNQPQRVFIDVDGEMLDINESDFYSLNQKIQDAFMSYEPLCGIRTSSKYQTETYTYNKYTKETDIKIKNKISFVILYKKMTATVATMKEWIIKDELPRLQALLQGIIPISTSSADNQINIDTSVYPHVDKLHKMRCANAYKNYQDKSRISRILKGKIEENVIQNIDNCIEITPFKQPDPEIKIKIKEDKPKPKKNQVVDIEDSEDSEEPKKPMTITPIIRQVCENIDKKKWTDYNDWLKILFIWKNENWNYEDFNTLSQNFGGKKYNEECNEIIWNKTQKKKGLTQATLWLWLKEFNLSLFKSLQPKREDFYKLIIEGESHLDFAVLFYNLEPSKYVFSHKTKWWEYNQQNILVHTGDDQPVGLKNNVAGYLRDYFNEQRKYLDMNDKDYEKRNTAINNIYKKLGNASFCKGIIEFLPSLYLNSKFEDLIDNNRYLLAFDNCVYDIKTNKERPIEPTDYISKTCGYDYIHKSNPEIRKELDKLFESIFPDVETREYYKKITALSFFFNNFESFYVLTGSSGRNGKGVLSSLIRKSLGQFFYTADPTFLTSVIKYGVANPTLSQCKGVRYLSVSEPDTGASVCNLNVELVKSLTGCDPITTRGLFQSNQTFENHFSVFLQCNQKPTLDKLEPAIIERLKCIPFTQTFISNPDPSNPNEHYGNCKLKEQIQEPKFINEFMNCMLEIAYINKDLEKHDIKISSLCKESLNEYVEENNVFKFWFESNYKKIVIPINFKDLEKEEQKKYIIRTKTSTILTEFNGDKERNEQITAKKLRNAMTFNKINIEIYNGSSVIKGYERIEEEEDKKINDLDK
jgi:phage/plasmid-associated DNA primase